MTYEVRVEWGVRRPDGPVAPMPSESIAHRVAASSDRFTLVHRVVARIPWTADLDAALDEVDRLRSAVGRRKDTP